MIRTVIIILIIGSPLAASSTSEPPTQRGSTTECRNVSKVLGFAVVNVKNSIVLPFFTKPDYSKPPALTVRLFQDQAINSINHRVEGVGTFRPATLHLDHHLFELSAKSRHRGWLKVVVDEQTDRTLWIREGRDVRFVSWLSKMRTAFAVARTNQEMNQLRVKPLSNSRALRLKGKDCFKVERMRGEWIKVAQQSRCDEGAGPSVGWVKWRDSRGCLLIYIHPFA